MNFMLEKITIIVIHYQITGINFNSIDKRMHGATAFSDLTVKG